jgi:hypothetical protein
MKKSFKTILSHDDLNGELPVVVKPILDAGLAQEWVC